MNTIICIILLVLAVPDPQGGGPPPAKVSVAPVTRREFRPQIEALGEVRAFRHSAVSTEIAGLVDAVNVDAGDRVAAGAVLVALDTELAEIRRRQAQAELLLAREQLSEFRAGSRPEDVREAEAQLAQAKAALVEAERDVARIESLRATDISSEKDLTGAEAAAARARAVVDEQQAILDRVVAGPRQELIARAEAQVGIREALLALIEKEIEKCSITAPFAGAVTVRNVVPGHYVRPGDPLVTLLQIDPVDVIIDVSDQVVARVEAGSEVTLSVDALPGETFVAAVTAVIPQADVLARTFPVRVVVPNRQGRLLPGMVARAKVPVGAGESGLAVPLDALVRSAAGVVVFVVENGAARPVPVTAGTVAGDVVQVAGDLEEGAQVVVRGNERLFPGNPVIVVPDAEGPAGDGS